MSRRPISKPPPIAPSLREIAELRLVRPLLAAPARETEMSAIVAWATLLAFAGWNGRAMAQETASGGTPLASRVTEGPCAPESPLAATFEPTVEASALEHVARVGDTLAMGAGLVLGGAMFLGAASVPVIAGAAAVGLWQLGRAAWRLVKRRRDGLTLSLRDPAARAAWLSVLAGGATIGAASARLAAVALLARPATEIAFGLGTARRVDRVRDWIHQHGRRPSPG